LRYHPIIRLERLRKRTEISERITRPIFEPRNSRIRGRSVNYLTATELLHVSRAVEKLTVA
jgi:hypothetical protein